MLGLSPVHVFLFHCCRQWKDGLLNIVTNQALAIMVKHVDSFKTKIYFSVWYLRISLSLSLSHIKSCWFSTLHECLIQTEQISKNSHLINYKRDICILIGDNDRPALETQCNYIQRMACECFVGFIILLNRLLSCIVAEHYWIRWPIKSIILNGCSAIFWYDRKINTIFILYMTQEYDIQ